MAVRSNFMGMKATPSPTAREIGSKGGKARWRGTTPEQRSAEMRRVVNERWKGNVRDEVSPLGCGAIQSETASGQQPK